MSTIDITDLAVEECLIIARHIYLKSEDIEKTLCVERALECICIDGFMRIMHTEKFSAYTLVRHAMEVSHSIANDPILLNNEVDKLWAEKFGMCAKELAKIF